MKTTSNIKRVILGLAVLGVGFGVTQGAAFAASSKSSTDSQQTLANIISKGTAAINLRLTTLGNLSGQVSSSAKLSSADKTYLSNEISGEISGLTALKTKLAADTTVAEANTDNSSIYSSYRVYALVVPKVGIVSTADNQITKEAALTTQAQTLQTEITTDQNAGKDVSSVQTALNNMNTQITNAQSISSGMESTVLPLLPSDWNANRAILSGDNAQLATAAQDNVTANKDAGSIAASLKLLNKK